MPNDTHGELQTVPAAPPLRSVEGKIKSLSTTRKRVRKDNPGEETPNKRVKFKEPTSVSATNELDGQNANVDAQRTSKKRGRPPKASLAGEALEGSASAKSSPEKVPAANGRSGKRGRPPKVVAEGESSKPKESSKKKGKGTKGKESGPAPIPAPKWKLLQVNPTATTSSKVPESKQKPRIWFGSEDELQSTLPELTGPKCINGLSWEFYKTPILLLDEANSAFQVTQDDAHARYIDLVTTRTFVHSIPQKQQVATVTIPAPSQVDAPVHQIPRPTQTIPIPISNPEHNPAAYLVKLESKTYRFSPEPGDVPAMDLSMDPPRNPSSVKTRYPVESYEPSTPPFVATQIDFASAQSQTYNYLFNSNPYRPPVTQSNTWYGTSQTGMMSYEQLPSITRTDESSSSPFVPNRINFTAAPLPTYNSSYNSNPYRSLVTQPNAWGRPSQTGTMSCVQLSSMVRAPTEKHRGDNVGYTGIPSSYVKINNSYDTPGNSVGWTPPRGQVARPQRIRLTQPQSLPLTSSKRRKQDVPRDHPVGSSVRHEGNVDTVLGKNLESNQSTNTPIDDPRPTADSTDATRPESTQKESSSTNEHKSSDDVDMRVDLIPKLEPEEPVLLDTIEGHAQQLAQVPEAVQATESSQATEPVDVHEPSQALASTQASKPIQPPVSTRTSELIHASEVTRSSEATTPTPENLYKDPVLVPTPLPEEIQIIINAYLSGTPLTLIVSRGHLLHRWSLRSQKGIAYAMMGYFKIIGIQETLLESTHADGQINGQQSISGQVKWLFRLQWRPGGEEYIMPKTDPPTLEYPWWVPPPDTNDVDEEMEEGKSPGNEPEADAAQTPTDPEDDFPTTPRYRQARLANHEYEFRHDHYRLIYESLLPISLLAPFGPLVLDSAFPQGWFCTNCGRVNYQAALRHRICASSSQCKDMPSSVEPYKVDLFSMRDPQDRLPIAHPYDTWPKSIEPKILKHENGVQTITYSLNENGTASIKHVFLGNFEELQKQATALLDKIQIQVELKRPFNDSSPYFSYAAKAPKTMKNPTEDPWPKVPDCINEAKASVSSGRFLFGLEDSRISINRLTVLAWVTAGARKGPEILRAKEKCVVIVAFGCDVVLTLTSRSIELLPAAQKLPKINGGRSSKLNSDSSQSLDMIDPVIQETTTATSSKVKTPVKTGKPSFALFLVHGDCVVLDGDDFEYTIKRDGTSFLLIASYEKA